MMGLDYRKHTFNESDETVVVKWDANLNGLKGDKMGVILATAGAKLRKLLRLLSCAWKRGLDAMSHLTVDIFTPPIRVHLWPERGGQG